MSTIYLNDLIIPKYDTLLEDILDHKYVHYTLYGGRGSTKSSFISIAIIMLITMPEHRDVHAVIFRKVANTLRDSVYSQISFAISLLGMEKLFKRTVSPMEMTYIPTGQKLLFRGLDEPEKIKSIKAPFGYFGITWEEEIDQLKGREEVRKILQSTMRGKDGIFWNFESFNPPISSNNWANKDLLIKRKDRICVKTSYLDVPREWLSETFFDEANFLRDSNERAYRHEYLGEATGTGLNVFENITLRPITDKELETFDRIYYGLDFGYFPDAAHFGEMYFNSHQRKLYIYREIRKLKMRNEDLAKELDAWRTVKITADSAESKSIADFQAWGFQMYGAIKGPGSIEYGIKWLQSLNEIIIDPSRCPYTADEFTTYEYLKDKEGQPITGYPDENNHSIDMVRYALEEVWRRRGQ